MELLFFTALNDEARRVRCVEDLLDEPAAEPMTVRSPGGLVALSRALVGPSAQGLDQLRDATCQSFPVWRLATLVSDALAQLPDDDLDRVAEAWRVEAGDGEIDANLFELTTCLMDLRDALRNRRSGQEALFALLEEKSLF